MNSHPFQHFKLTEPDKNYITQNKPYGQGKPYFDGAKCLKVTR